MERGVLLFLTVLLDLILGMLLVEAMDQKLRVRFVPQELTEKVVGACHIKNN